MLTCARPPTETLDRWAAEAKEQARGKTAGSSEPREYVDHVIRYSFCFLRIPCPAYFVGGKNDKGFTRSYSFTSATLESFRYNLITCSSSSEPRSFAAANSRASSFQSFRTYQLEISHHTRHLSTTSLLSTIWYLSIWFRRINFYSLRDLYRFKPRS